MATPKSAVLATLIKAKNAAILNLSSGGALNEARAHVGIALSNLIHGTVHQRHRVLIRPRRNRGLDMGIRSIASGVNVMALIAQIALGVIIGGLTIALLVTGFLVWNSRQRKSVWLLDYLSPEQLS